MSSSGGYPQVSGNSKVLLSDANGEPVSIWYPNSDSMSLPTNPLGVSAAAMLYDPNTGEWVRQRTNGSGTLLASATRTSTTLSPVITNYNYKGIIVTLNVTAASGTGGLQVVLYSQDPVSGGTFWLHNAPTAVTTTGLKEYLLYPGAAINGSLSFLGGLPLPRTFGVEVIVGDSSSYMYSVGYQIM